MSRAPTARRGVQGEAGISALTLVKASSDSNSGDTKTITVSCEDAGEELFAISGGASLSGATSGVGLTASAPTGVAGSKPLGWTASAAEFTAQSGSWTLEVYVVCAQVQD